MSRYVDSRFLIRPLEAVYFGRPRPFSAGEAHHGSSEFPPSGYTFQGMVRSQLLRSAQPALDLDSPASQPICHDLVGGPDALPKDWQLTGPWPARAVQVEGAEYLEPWLPTPLFLLGKRGQRCRARPVPGDEHPALGDRDITLLGRPDLGLMKPLKGWVDSANLAFALAGKGDWHADGYRRHLPPFFHREQRPGLALDGDTARHGMLYFLDGLRCHDPQGGRAGLYGRLQGSWDQRLPDKALAASLGGAGKRERPAAFEPALPWRPEFEDLLLGNHLPQQVDDESAQFWLVTLTPAAVKDAMKPLNLATGEVRFKVLGMLSDVPQTFGGFRFADATSRPNRAYLPAGTCWLFSLSGGNPQQRGQILRQLNHAHPLGDSTEARFGFGHTLVGLGPQTEEI